MEGHEKLEKLRSQIQIRVMSVLRHWLEDHWEDFEFHPHMLYQLIRWINDVLIPSGMNAMANSLKKAMMKKLVNCDNSSELNFSFSKKAPPSIIPKGDGEFMEIDPVEIARQLCLLEQRLYKMLSLREFLDQKWNKGQKNIAAPGIVAFIDHFNTVSMFVSRSIVMQLNIRKRTKNIEKWVAIAAKCREYRNFNATMSILSGLRAASVYRLRKTWAGVDGKILALHDSLLELMSQENNWERYRNVLGSEDPPCIPYLGVYLTDLTFLDDAMANVLANGAINWEKRRKLATLILEVHQYQQEPYGFLEVKSIQEDLSKNLSQQSSYTERDLFNISLIIEPKT